MTCRAPVREQPGGRFALIDILSVCPAADQHGKCAKDEQTAPPFLQRHKFRRTLHAAVALRRNRTALVMSTKRRRSQPRTPKQGYGRTTSKRRRRARVAALASAGDRGR